MASPPSPPRDADPTTGPIGSSTDVKPTSLHPPGPWPTTPPPPSSTPDGMVPISDMAGPDSESGNDAMMRPILFFRLVFRFSFFSDSMSFDEFLFFEFFVIAVVVLIFSLMTHRKKPLGTKRKNTQFFRFRLETLWILQHQLQTRIRD